MLSARSTLATGSLACRAQTTQIPPTREHVASAGIAKSPLRQAEKRLGKANLGEENNTVVTVAESTNLTRHSYSTLWFARIVMKPL